MCVVTGQQERAGAVGPGGPLAGSVSGRVLCRCMDGSVPGKGRAGVLPSRCRQEFPQAPPQGIIGTSRYGYTCRQVSLVHLFGCNG